MRRYAIVVLAFACFSLSKASGGVSFSDPRFSVYPAVTGTPISDRVTTIFLSPGGDFGPGLFIGGGNSGVLYRAVPGQVPEVYATGLPGLEGIAISEAGTFGSFLYVNCEDVPDGIRRIDPLTQIDSGQLTYVNEGMAIAVSPGGAYGDYLYAAQALGQDDNYVYRVNADFEKTPFALLGYSAYITDIAFSSRPSFGDYLYTVGRLDQHSHPGQERYVQRIDSSGNVSIFASQSLGSGWYYLAFSPGGVWGDYLYVHCDSELYRISPTGSVELFGSGFSNGGGLAFSEDGSVLYLGQTGQAVIVLGIVPEPGTLSLLALGGLVMIRRK